MSLLPEHALSAVEADSFWCLDRMLSGVHDYYIVAQPGIVRSVRKMAELVARIDRACKRLRLSVAARADLFFDLLRCQRYLPTTSRTKGSSSCSLPSGG